MEPNGLTMKTDKCSSIYDQAKGFLDQQIVVLLGEIPTLITPRKTIELCEVVNDLVEKDLVLEKHMGESMKKRLISLKEKGNPKKTPGR